MIAERPPQLQQCSRCKIYKPLTLFHRIRKGQEKRQKICAECSQLNKLYYKKLKEGFVCLSKFCPKCQQTKLSDQFYPDLGCRDGLYSYCKACEADRIAAYNLTLPAKQGKAKRNHKRRLLDPDLPTDRLTLATLHKRFRLVNVMLFDHSCPYCGDRLEYTEATLDHFMPLSKEGTNEIENIIHCCGSCNSAKSNSYPYRWIMKRFIDRGIPFDPQLWQDITSKDWDSLVYKYIANN